MLMDSTPKYLKEEETIFQIIEDVIHESQPTNIGQVEALSKHAFH
jgi:hypothetical protein